MEVTAPPEVIGRDEELATIAGFLAAPERLPGTLLLEGEAGIGKTTLYRHALTSASEHSYRVLACSPTGAEQQLSYGAVGDLLEGVLDDVLGELPRPQERALRVALLLEDAEGRRPDQRAIALAFLGALRLLARDRAVLLAVDDVQWLDSSSAALVEYAVRRLRDEPIGLLLTRRVEEKEGALPLGLEREFGEERLVSLSIGPLSLGALHRLIARRLGVACSRPTLRRIHEASAGNAFFALEIARAWQRAGGVSTPGHELPIPTAHQQLLDERIAALPEPTQESLLVAASVAEPKLGLVLAAVGRELELEPALEADVIELEGDRIRFVHPLLESTVRARATAARRRAVHRTLSQLVPSAEERARQLALATEGPDEVVAEALHAAARAAFRRGALSVSAELFEHALGFTPEHAREARLRRTLEAADVYFEVGDTRHSLRLLEELVATMPSGRDRAEVLYRLGWVKSELASGEEALLAYEQVLLEAGEDVKLRASTHCQIAWLECCVAEQDSAARQVRAGIELAESTGDPDLIAEALAAGMFVDLLRGVRNEENARRALELEGAGGRVRIDSCPSIARGSQLLSRGELDAARSLFESVLRLARERGDESNASAPLFSLARLEVLAGDWDRAEECVREAEERAEQTGVNRLETLSARLLVDVHRGRVDEARAEGEALLGAAEEAGERLSLLRCLSLLGLLELSCGDVAGAHSRLDRAAAVARVMRIRAPSYLRFLADDAEALVALGELDEAEAALEELARPSLELEHSWGLSLVDRSRGLLLAARGDLPGAESALEQALARQEQLPLPFERARTLLALGQTQRRGKQKRAARESLAEALEIFERLGARLWVERAREELGRIGGRAAASDELTPTERRVAELVAEGRSNKDAAAALFVTVKTVEANLSRVYTKLGIRSRTELARRLASKV